tara:strand:- start:294 stop:515 length:222 start_codon:yes stop_codon:yes gene_type:complete
MLYKGEKLTIEISPIELEVITTGLASPVIMEFLDECDDDKMLVALDELKTKLRPLTTMVAEAGFGYEDNWGEN